MIKFKSILLVVGLGLFSSALAQQNVQKEFHKELEVQADALIEIQNQFGDLKITSWDENKVVIDVLITVKGSNSKRIQEKLDEIEVYFDLNPDHVSARTEIEESWSTKLFNRSRLSFRIDYTVKLPRSSQVDLTNDYGSIVLNALDGSAKINCDFGKLLIGELNSENNELFFDYTNNSSFDFIRAAKIYADFSSFDVEEAGRIELEADYTSSEFNTLQELEFKNDFGKLIIARINSLRGRGDYLTLKVGTLFHSAELDNEFGLIRINEVMPATQSIKINSEYTGVQLGISPEWEFLHEIDLEFASLKSSLNLNYKIQRTESTKKYYQGFHLNENTTNSLHITSEFGSVKLTSNP